MEGARPTKLIEVSFYVGVHDLNIGKGGIPIPTKITAKNTNGEPNNVGLSYKVHDT